MLAVTVGYWLSSPAETLPIIGHVHEFTLTNQLGAPVTRVSLADKVHVFNIIFSRCPTQCHILSHQMAQVQRGSPDGVALWSLTADPEYDTPAVLARYGADHGANPAVWQFLTGPKREVYRFASADLLFSVMENANPKSTRLDELFIHSADFVLVDRQGRLRAVVHGEEPHADRKVLKYVRALLRE
ncbi:MAG: SCO family protein [Pedosphaera sp.]|nr:SCO family protein [Pedosphaera sp.]